ETWWNHFDTDSSAGVFVPLCGKSLDMLWLLEQGHTVTGVELNEPAVSGFFSQHGISFVKEAQPPFTSYRGDGLDIHVGDFFKLPASFIAGNRLVFDRAALIALPPAMRIDYADKLREILAPGCKIFLITVVYDQNAMNGPPFSVQDDEVYKLFDNGFEIKKVNASDDPSLLGGLAKRGLKELAENVFFLTRTD
ncbi:MAG: thiopurine S-methyltransferase, partial [Gammaproteobacteria bacterium]|nr:thiopurine S-methyltransferase [Gammaproteobacteria bacterium]